MAADCSATASRRELILRTMWSAISRSFMGALRSTDCRLAERVGSGDYSMMLTNTLLSNDI